jgi:iterative type I PKS product template protein
MNENPLCPSAVHADMALTVADYLHRSLRPDEQVPGLNVAAVEVHKPLIAQIPAPKDGQHIQLEASADLASAEVKLQYRTVKWDGTLLQELGHGLVKYEDVAEWTESWASKQYLVAGQIEMLERKYENGQAHKLLNTMAYKLFAVLLDYSPKYHGMRSIILDSASKSAVATIKFQTTPADGDFFCSPYFIDNMCHISGFIVNAADESDEEPLVYISHGWSAMKMAQMPSAEKTYKAYVHMMTLPGNMASGDVYVMDESSGEIVTVFEECRFQGLQRRLMDVLLPRPKKTPRVVFTPPFKHC